MKRFLRLFNFFYASPIFLSPLQRDILEWKEKGNEKT